MERGPIPNLYLLATEDEGGSDERANDGNPSTTAGPGGAGESGVEVMCDHERLRSEEKAGAKI